MFHGYRTDCYSVSGYSFVMVIVRVTVLLNVVDSELEIIEEYFTALDLFLKKYK